MGRLFKKGESGNPAGRPKRGTSISEAMRRVAGEEIEVNGKKMTKGEFIAEKVFAMAAQGDLAAAKLYLERVDGAPKQQMELSGPDGGPIETSVQVEFLAPGTGVQAENEAEQEQRP